MAINRDEAFTGVTG